MAHGRRRILFYLAYCGYCSLLLVGGILAAGRFLPSYRERSIAPETSLGPIESDAERARRHHDSVVASPWPIGALRCNDEIGWEMTPGFSGRRLDGSYSFKLHDLGYRIPIDTDGSAFDTGGVLSIGCSFTWGDGVEAEEAFAYLTARGLGLSSYNFGVCGYSYASCVLQLRILEKRGILDRLRPSILILGAGKWLYHRSLSPHYPTTGFQFEYAYIGNRDGKIEIRQPPRQFRTRHLFEFLSQYFPDHDRDVPFTPERERLLQEIIPRADEVFERKQTFRDSFIPEDKVYAFVVSNIRNITRRHHIDSVVLWMPRPGSGHDPPDAMSRVLSRYRDTDFIDGRVVIEEEESSGGSFLPNRHPNRNMHRRLADLLLERIRE